MPRRRLSMGSNITGNKRQEEHKFRKMTGLEQRPTSALKLSSKVVWSIDNFLCRKFLTISSIVRSMGRFCIFHVVIKASRSTGRIHSSPWPLFRSLNFRGSSVRVKTPAIRCVQVVWVSLLSEMITELLATELEENWIYFYSWYVRYNKKYYCQRKSKGENL